MKRVPSQGELFWQFFRYGSNAFSVLVLLVLAKSLLSEGRGLQALPYLPIGFLIFLVLEYVSHRFQLHPPVHDEAGVRRVERTLHSQHHLDPQRIDRLFVPLRDTVPIAAVLTLVYLLVTRDWLMTRALLMGTFLGFLYYEHTHFVAHVNVTPATRWGRFMKKYHLWHHYKNENYWFGVTSPIFDLLLGTYRDPGLVEKSPTARNLHSS